jgi:hypothetical protein
MILSSLKELELFVNEITWLPDDLHIKRENQNTDYEIHPLYFPDTPFIKFELAKVENHDNILLELQKFGYVFYKNTTYSELVNIDKKSTINITKNFNFDSASNSFLKSDFCIIATFSHFESNKDFVVEMMTFLINKIYANKSENEHKFYMIAQAQSGLYNIETTCKASPIKDDRYDLYYGKKFPHDQFLKFVTEDTNNFLLLHGDPGTGKSNYIKNLLSLSKRDVIYIPPSMLAAISRPDFVSYMLNNKGKILLIEDAEQVLSIDRNSATNNLLGLTDGFLKDSLDLKVIATMNAPLNQIDPALMRKGRLHFEYKFDKLSADEGQDLVDFLSINKTITEPMTLAEIFNEEEVAIEDSFEKRVIGFGAY